jgi:hypothetical protein
MVGSWVGCPRADGLNDQANLEAIYTVGPILIAVLAPGLAWSARGWDAH